MGAAIERWRMPFLTGKCFDFALALAEHVDEPRFVALGDAVYADHVGLQMGDWFLDVRGVLTECEFRSHYTTLPLVEAERSGLELMCGLAGIEPPYRGSGDIKRAREAVSRAFPHGVDDALSTRMDGEPTSGLAAGRP